MHEINNKKILFCEQGPTLVSMGASSHPGNPGPTLLSQVCPPPLSEPKIKIYWNPVNARGGYLSYSGGGGVGPPISVCPD